MKAASTYKCQDGNDKTGTKGGDNNYNFEKRAVIIRANESGGGDMTVTKMIRMTMTK